MERKDFFRVCALGCLGGLGIAAFLQACGTASHYASATLNGKQIKIAKSEFTFLKDGVSKERTYVLVKVESLSFPICLYKLSSDTYSALLMECTHKSCELQAHGDYLICPCHGSEFSNQGKVQNPPAETNLKTFITSNDNAYIYIQL